MNYKTYNYKNKEIRIYEWENKPFKDFPIPEGFKMIEFNEFNELIEKEIIKLEVWKDYFVQHWNKQMRKRGIMSRVCLYSGGGLGSDSDAVDDSCDSGQVVVIKSKFNLSKKIKKAFLVKSNDFEEIIKVEDVKEFIKKLKMEIDSIDFKIIGLRGLVKNKIDKLSGDDLLEK